ncbi:MAG: histidine kinase [Bacteroidota bacterium]
MNLLDVDIDQRRTHYLKVVGIPEKVTQYYDWLVDDTGIHWLATDQGVFLCEKRGNSRLHVFQTIKLLENLDVYCLFLDKERNLWIGTAQTGLFLMPSAKTFKWDLKEQGLANQYVKLLTAYNSEKVVGITNEGYLLEVSKDSFEAKKVLPRGDYKGIYLGPNHRKFAYGNQPFYEITSGEKVISYFNDDVSNRFTGNNVKSLIWWNDKIYSGDPNGFVILDKTREKTRLLLEGRTMKVFKDRFKDEIWLGNINGLHVFSETDSVRLYQDKSGNKVPFLIYSMAQSNDSSLFLGSHGKGLWVLKNGVLTRIDSILGIESKIYSELMVSGSDLWATTENGLYKANLTEMKSQKLNLNGLSSYSTVFGLTETKDMIWVSTLEGITFFPKEQSKDKIRPPNVYLDKFIARNISGETSNSYDLPYAFRHVRIQFSAVYFQGQLEYKVKSGEEQYWSSLKEPRLELSSLAPGNYTYFIKAITPNGTESEEPLEISFTINPPIWLTLEFWILLLLGMGVIMFLGIRYYINKRVQRVKDIAKMQRQIDQFRLQALRAQMNPHFTFNALNGIQSLLLKEQTDSALRYLADFSQLIRKSLDKSDDDWINLKDEIAFLKNYIKLEELRFGDKVKVYWVGEQTFGIDRLVIPNMILQPIVENAFKHGLSHLHANGQLLIGIDVQKEIITIVVEDNGIGRKRSAEYSRELHPNHQSKGLSMVQDRLDWLYRDQRQKARIYILDLPQNGPDSLQKSTFLQGTLVSLKLPLIYEKIE